MSTKESDFVIALTIEIRFWNEDR